MREKVDPGNWELHLDGGTAKIKLIDDSSTEQVLQLNKVVEYLMLLVVLLLMV